MIELDPVCHMQVETDSAEHYWDYQGKRHYFCWDGCRRKFQANPLTYLSADYDPAKVDFDTMGDVQFTCPMHPEVQNEGPGICPKCGMGLEPATPSLASFSDSDEMKDMSCRFRVAAICSVPLLAIAMSDMFGAGHLLPDAQMANNVELALASPVVLWCGLPIFARAVASIKHRSLNMFTLIGAGSGIAYLFSIFTSLLPQTLPASMLVHGAGPVYFETAAVIITLVLLGQVLELRARSRAGGAIRDLLSLTPNTARRLGLSGEEVDVATSEIRLADKLRVRTGDKVPVDGSITDGTGVLDESMISGEPFPVSKAVGDSVVAGTINTEGSFVMSATRIGSQTLLSQIVQMVADAQRTQAPIQSLADKVAAYFVPMVIAIAGLTFACWFVLGPKPSLLLAVVNTISVLIVACPCALGLATPMSVMVAAGRGAKAGILIANASVLEIAEHIEVVALDKTGTLTEGRPTVSKVVAMTTAGEDELVRLAAGLEMHSSHPVARALLEYAKERGIAFVAAQDSEIVSGKGIKGRIGDTLLIVGNARLMTESGIDSTEVSEAIRDVPESASTTIFVASGHTLIGVISIIDPIKQSSSTALSSLRAMGIETIMITGDSAAAAKKIGAQLGFAENEIFAEVLPAEKGDVIDAMRSSGKIVAMAGDGINDAVALSKANVGIAMGHGADIALKSASVTLVKGDLRGILRMLKLSRITMRNIRQNLFFAFVYNAIGIVLASGALYHWLGWLLSPMIASAAMSLSSVCVISNALRLQSAKLE